MLTSSCISKNNEMRKNQNINANKKKFDAHTEDTIL